MAELESLPYILIASDEGDYSLSLSRFLDAQNYAVERCHDAQGVLRLVGRREVDVLILDLSLLDKDNLDLISFVRRQSPATQIILIFDIHQVSHAFEGIRKGAFFYLPRSCEPSDVALIIDKAVRALKTQASLVAYEQSLLEEVSGNTPAMKRVVELITKVAPTDSTVLLLGESGTGKEVIANTVHRLSARQDRPFIAVNCAAIPEQLLESELFGHIKGAFTGAESDKIGLFKEADGGTLFLDEVGEMPLVAQAKLLRVVQNGEIRRVGDSKIEHVDVRILAATNIDLVRAVEEKFFREDLYFRLNVIQIVIPPLRERPDAIAPLAKSFLDRYNAKFNRSVQSMDEHAWLVLQNYRYPGNIRELESIIAHAVIMAEGDTMRIEDLPDQMRTGKGVRLALPNYAQDDIPTLQEMEKSLIEMALEKLKGNQTEVAKKMGISRSTLWRKMKEYGISRTSDGEETLDTTEAT